MIKIKLLMKGDDDLKTVPTKYYQYITHEKICSNHTPITLKQLKIFS